MRRVWEILRLKHECGRPTGDRPIAGDCAQHRRFVSRIEGDDWQSRSHYEPGNRAGTDIREHRVQHAVGQRRRQRPTQTGPCDALQGSRGGRLEIGMAEIKSESVADTA
jgi:hypothetical protein